MDRVRAEGLVGREDELAAVEACVFGDDAVPLVIAGYPGIGKTAVWTAVVSEARRRGIRVLVSRPAAADASLDFVGLADLFEGVALDQVAGLSAPQSRALEAALLRRDAQDEIDVLAVHLAVLSVVRELSARDRLLVAIDDVQCLDGASAGALAFAGRRLADGAVRFLFTERMPASSPTMGALLGALTPERIELGPLSFGATGRLLGALGLSLTRSTARRLYELTGGNPLFALELGRMIGAGGGLLRLGQEMPLPDSVETVLAGRVAGLTPAARRALLAAALAPGATIAVLRGASCQDGVDQAVGDGVLVAEGLSLRLAHPLLGEAVKAQAPPSELRGLHARLAEATSDPERRALHLSDAADEPDTAVAEQVAAAARHAERRAAFSAATVLGERALALTPPNDPDREKRLLDAAYYNWRAGELTRTTELLEPALPLLRAGEARARGYLLYALSAPLDTESVVAWLTRALEEAVEPSLLRAEALYELAHTVAGGTVEELRAGEAMAAESLQIARALGSVGHHRGALGALIWLRSLRGMPVADLVAEAGQLPADPAALYHGPERIVATRSIWRGEIAEARLRLRELVALADARGEGEAHFALRLQLCELELRAGRWEAVEGLVEEWGRERGEVSGHLPGLLRCRALLAVGRGDGETAIHWATEARREYGRGWSDLGRWNDLELSRAEGLAAFLGGDAAKASAHLGEVWAYLRAQGLDEPGAFPVAPDLAEALVAAGRSAEAIAVTETLEQLAEGQDHPWGRAALARCRGHLMLAGGDPRGASAAFGEAVERFTRLELAFDAARALVGRGTAERALRRRSDARATLQEAVVAFEAIGSPGWAERAKAELARVGRRQPAADGLTATERRVAELVARGLANKQVAATLVVTVGAVEAHLTRIYAKLGVSSRTELVRVMVEPSAEPHQNVG